MPNEVDYGQLGLGIDLNGPKCVNTLYLIPTMIGKDVIKVASTGYHTMMLTRDGKVFACGSNAFGQLGCGDRKSRCTPVAVNGLPPIKDIVCGYAFSAAITRDGKLYTWGFNKNGRCGHPTEKCKFTVESKHPYLDVPTLVADCKDVASVACGSGHTIVLDIHGNVFSFGRNDVGQCGVFNPLIDYRPDTFIVNLPHREHEYKLRKLDLPKIVQIGAGSYYSVAVSKEGELYYWGALSGIHFSPQKIEMNFKVKRLSCGSEFCYAFADEGVIILPDGTFVQSSSFRIEDISTSGDHLVMISGGILKAAGDGTNGKLGMGNELNVAQSSPVPIKSGDFVLRHKKVVCGKEHTIVISEIKKDY